MVPLSVGVPGDTTGATTNSIYTAQVELAYVCDASSTSLYGVFWWRGTPCPYQRGHVLRRLDHRASMIRLITGSPPAWPDLRGPA